MQSNSMYQCHQTSPSNFQNMSRASNATLRKALDGIEVGGTGMADTAFVEPTLEPRYAHNECKGQEQCEDFPENLHHLRQPYYAMNHQPGWDLQTSGMHMSASYDTYSLQGRLSAQGRPSDMPSSSNLDPFLMQSWLDAVILTPFTTYTGKPGSQIVVAFQIHPAATTLPTLLFYIMFGDQSSPATLVTPCNPHSHHEYFLTARIPALSGPGEAVVIPLSITAENNGGKMLFQREIGDYIFDGCAELLFESSTHRESLKRRLSDSASGEGVIPWKRSKVQPTHEGAATSAGAHELPLSTPVLRYATPVRGHHVEQIQPQSLHRGYFTPDSHFRSPFRPLQPSSQQDFTPLTRSISHGAYPAYASLYPSPAATMSRCSSQRVIFNSSPSMPTSSYGQGLSVYPNQVRTGSSSGPPPSHVSTTANVSARPNLIIEGDLETMLDDWSEEEVLAKRRLVVFERNQSGHTVSITFRAVTPEARTPGSACVSCIWWEERQGGYVTSVDTIALAESLCGYKFNVPVKNRIRRNLEGYKPTTVAKDKEDSEEFFKVVMGFPAPKPRNIEKHIKVFPWKSLGRALKKIIGKYVSKAGSGSTARKNKSMLTAIQSPTSSSTIKMMPAGEQNGVRGSGQGRGHVAGRVGVVQVGEQYQCQSQGQSQCQYLPAHLSPSSATSYEMEMSVAGSRTSESPFFDAAAAAAARPRPGPRPRPRPHPRSAHLDAGNVSSDQGPSTFQSADLGTIPHAALHDYRDFSHDYTRQQDESSDTAYYPWPGQSMQSMHLTQSMQSSYDPGLTATPTAEEINSYNHNHNHNTDTDNNNHNNNNNPQLGAVTAGGLVPTQAPAGPGMYAMAYYGGGQHAFHRTRSSM